MPCQMPVRLVALGPFGMSEAPPAVDYGAIITDVEYRRQSFRQSERLRSAPRSVICIRRKKLETGCNRDADHRLVLWHRNPNVCSGSSAAAFPCDLWRIRSFIAIETGEVIEGR